ncbi:hypothetical protein H0E87_027467 [Populus deltoides]|uniref:Uncharacterized protein n=1 Tax=Populus deltoides TaxID=3696 RepID=A0A8T2X1K9_POPDE|nr:hypothetical protein H0E87_027467 [Populus deltoides]
MKKAQLVLVPSPGSGHLVSTIEFAKRLLDQDESFLITVLVIKAPFALDVDTFNQSLTTIDTRISYITLPQATPPDDQVPFRSPENYFSIFLERHKSHVKDAILNHVMSKKSSVPVVGLVVDLFCSSMIDVAKELGIPSYVYISSSAGFLGLMLHLPTRKDQAGGYICFENHARRFKDAKGFIVNTFTELESHASLMESNLDDQHGKIMKWLDDQPEKSVVFLCFGSIGRFSEAQVKEIALGLEQSGHRFLCSIRKPPPEGQFAMPSDYMSFEEIAKSVKSLMEEGSTVRNKVKAVSEASRKAVVEGGSSFAAFGDLIEIMLS